MSAEQFKNDSSRLPQNVTGWIELTDELRDSFEFQHGSVWLMAVPVYDRRDLKSWDYDLHAVAIDCDGPLRFECDDRRWSWELVDVAYMALLRK